MLKIVGIALLGFSLLNFEAAVAAPTPEHDQPNAPLYDRAPWWMRSPIIAATGQVQTHIFANRAAFSAQFAVVDPSLDVATHQVTDRVRALTKTLIGLGADKAQVETSLSITPNYQQYRDKQGELQTNDRADKIESYQASVRFSVEVRDVAVLERAYDAVVAARPASIQPVYFQLEPDNETNTELFKAAIADATRRARLAAESAGAQLGRVMLIDPTARACETDVLVAGAPRTYGEDAGGTQEVVVTGMKRASASMMAPAPPLPPPPSPNTADDQVIAPEVLLPVQPPLEALERKACVIFSLD